MSTIHLYPSCEQVDKCKQSKDVKSHVNKYVTGEYNRKFYENNTIVVPKNLSCEKINQINNTQNTLLTLIPHDVTLELG